MPRGEKKVFECVICSDRYGKQAVETQQFFIDSFVCEDCYKKMQDKPASVSCFGKLPHGRSFGFDQQHIACSSICPDRIACAHFITKLKRTRT